LSALSRRCEREPRLFCSQLLSATCRGVHRRDTHHLRRNLRLGRLEGQRLRDSVPPRKEPKGRTPVAEELRRVGRRSRSKENRHGQARTLAATERRTIGIGASWRFLGRGRVHGASMRSDLVNCRSGGETPPELAGKDAHATIAFAKIFDVVYSPLLPLTFLQTCYVS